MKLLALTVHFCLIFISIGVSKGQDTSDTPIIQVGPEVLNDKAYTELTPGRVLTYKLRVDQHVVHGRGVCIPAIYSIAILDRDAAGNSRVSVEMRSAGELIASDTIFLSKSTVMKIVGVRLAFAIPKYEATLDVNGRVLYTNEQLDAMSQESSTMGNVESRITDSDAMANVLSTIPTEYALMAPYLQGATSILVGRPYKDTILFTSAIQKIGRTIGTETRPQPKEAQDTIIRTVTIDSVSGSGNDELAHMTVRMERYPVYGMPSVAISVMERYIKKGYMKSFVTTSRKVGSTSPIPEYIATSILDTSTMDR